MPPRRQSRGFKERARIAAPSRLLRYGFKGDTPPVSAPAGYFWKRDIVGEHWRLYRRPFHTNTPRTETLRHDGVTVVTSSWGYIKPTYRYPDELEAERSRLW